MGFKSSYILCLTIFLAISSSIHAFDITKLLGDKPDYATFLKHLTETKLVDQINSHKTITVLAVNNAGLSSLSGKSPDAIKAILSTHVLLDFYDEKKLMQDTIGANKPLATLNQQGLVKVALIGEGSIAFGSAANGAPAPDSEIVQTVVDQPDEISIIEVSKLMVAPGSDSQTPASPSNAQAPAAGKTPAEGAKAPAASTKAPTASAKAPTTSAKAPAASSKAPTESAKAPVPTEGAKAHAPTEGAKAHAPAEGAKAPASHEEAKAPTQSAEAPDAKAAAPTTGAETPSSEEVTAPAPSEVVTDSPASGPAAGGETAADTATPASSSSRTIVGLVGAVMSFASFLVVM